MRSYVEEMVAAIGPRPLLVEYGSGSSIKTRILLDRLVGPVSYVPVDISAEHLMATAQRLRQAYPALDVFPVAADYMEGFTLPAQVVQHGGARRRVVYFPGSTLGNLDHERAGLFLQRLANTVGKGGGLLIGIDLQKDPRVIEAAYNDPTGLTAAFNQNILHRINRDLGGNFNVADFAHHAFYNPPAGRIEMHLVSLKDQAVDLQGHRIAFKAFETIWTESSYKYTLEGFAHLTRTAGLATEQVWTDERGYFCVQFLRVAGLD